MLAFGLFAAGTLDPPPRPTGLVVFDGDSFRLEDGRRVRLAGVDTPESGRPFADEATVFTAAFLRSGPLELVPEDPAGDAYGRLLADVRVDGRSLGEALLAAGLAWVYRSDDPRGLALQSAAVTERVGIHALDDRRAGPFLVTTRSFHRPTCWLVRRAAAAPVSARAGPLFADGRAPCRLCLRWPPAASPLHP